MKRFYEQATVTNVAGGYALLLDDRPVKSPSGMPLLVKSEVLAKELAEEWQRQGDKIDMPNMPLTRLAFGLGELNDALRKELREHALSYLHTDLLCYRETKDIQLKELQKQLWDPYLTWITEAYGVTYRVQEGVLPQMQEDALAERLDMAIRRFADHELIALKELVEDLGSLVLALAVTAGKANIEQALAAAYLDEDYQRERWGEDADVLARRGALARDLQSTTHFLSCFAK